LTIQPKSGSWLWLAGSILQLLLRRGGFEQAVMLIDPADDEER